LGANGETQRILPIPDRQNNKEGEQGSGRGASQGQTEAVGLKRLSERRGQGQQRWIKVFLWQKKTQFYQGGKGTQGKMPARNTEENIDGQKKKTSHNKVR